MIVAHSNINYWKNVVKNKNEIDSNVNEIKELLSTGNYDTIVYSIETYGSAIIGTGIFTISDEIKKYITVEILKLCLGNRLYFYSEETGISNYVKL